MNTKRWICLALATLLALLPLITLAAGEKYVKNTGREPVGIFAAIGDRDPVRTLAPGKQEKWLDEETVDGVLYTGDGKNLIQFPAGREGSYTVEPGTEVIQYGAFSKAKISEVVFPDSLAVIENAAFYNCSALNAPKLPDALTYIERVDEMAEKKIAFFGM